MVKVTVVIYDPAFVRILSGAKDAILGRGMEGSSGKKRRVKKKGGRQMILLSYFYDSYSSYYLS